MSFVVRFSDGAKDFDLETLSLESAQILATSLKDANAHKVTIYMHQHGVLSLLPDAVQHPLPDRQQS